MTLPTNVIAGQAGAIDDINEAWGKINALAYDSGDVDLTSLLQSGWTVAPFSAAVVRRVGNTVQLAVALLRDGAAGDLILTLPAAYRPTVAHQSMHFRGVADILPNGQVLSYAASGAFICHTWITSAATP